MSGLQSILASDLDETKITSLPSIRQDAYLDSMINNDINA